jgi:hypothetical protein
MTASEPPGEQPPEDDTALLIAALNHAWAWYDAQKSRSLQVINYFFVASAVLGTAYVGAINGKHYPLAAAVALAGVGLTAVTSLIELQQSFAVNIGGPVLGELQGRVADRLKIDMTRLRGSRAWTGRAAWIARRNYSAIAFGLALLVNIGALLYALIH